MPSFKRQPSLFLINSQTVHSRLDHYAKPSTFASLARFHEGFALRVL